MQHYEMVVSFTFLMYTAIDVSQNKLVNIQCYLGSVSVGHFMKRTFFVYAIRYTIFEWPSFISLIIWLLDRKCGKWNYRIFSKPQVGFADVREMVRNEIEVGDEELKHLVGNARFYSITFRLFKLASLESKCEDFGQVSIYHIYHCQNALIALGGVKLLVFLWLLFINITNMLTMFTFSLATCCACLEQ